MDSRFYKKEDVKYILYPQNINWFEVINKLFITKSRYIKIKENSDVLFMYNTSILNNSSIIAKFFR